MNRTDADSADARPAPACRPWRRSPSSRCASPPACGSTTAWQQKLALRAQLDAASRSAPGRAARAREWDAVAIPAGASPPARSTPRTRSSSTTGFTTDASATTSSRRWCSPTAASCSSTAAGLPAGATRAEIPEVAAARRAGRRAPAESTSRRRRSSSSRATRSRAACGRTSTSRATRSATGPRGAADRRRADGTGAARTTRSCATGPRPTSASRSTRIYMVQWFAFAALAAGLWAYFTLAPALNDDARAGIARRREPAHALLIALVAVAPVVASYAAYYWFPRDSRSTTASCCTTRPAPEVGGASAGRPGVPARRPARQMGARDRRPGACDATVRSGTLCDAPGAHDPGARDGADRARLVRHRRRDARSRAARPASGRRVVPRRAARWSPWPAGADRIYLVDPLGNLVLAWPREPDIKNDGDATSARLLKASRIG